MLPRAAADEEAGAPASSEEEEGAAQERRGRRARWTLDSRGPAAQDVRSGRLGVRRQAPGAGVP